MKLTLYNSLTRKREVFLPIDINLVKKTRSLINQKLKTKKVIKIYSRLQRAVCF